MTEDERKSYALLNEIIKTRINSNIARAYLHLSLKFFDMEKKYDGKN